MTIAEMPVPGLRRNANFRRLWLGQAVSAIGDYVFNTTVTLWITVQIAKGLSWAPAAVGGVVIAAAFPAMVVGPVAGVFVDRWNRRRTILAADACRAVLIACLLVLTLPAVRTRLSPLAMVGLIYLVVAVASAFAQFFNPSRFAVLALVVAPGDRAKASGMFQATGSFATIIGPPLAARCCSPSEFSGRCSSTPGRLRCRSGQSWPCGCHPISGSEVRPTLGSARSSGLGCASSGPAPSS
jgi:MFS family permease